MGNLWGDDHLQKQREVEKEAVDLLRCIFLTFFVLVVMLSILFFAGWKLFELLGVL
jgi:hypothetical protein